MSMAKEEGDVATAVAKKLKTYLDVQRREKLFDPSEHVDDISAPDIKVRFNKIVNSKNAWNRSTINRLRNEVWQMRPTKLSEKEAATKLRLECQMARHNDALKKSPYAHSFSDIEKRTQSRVKGLPKQRRIQSARRAGSAAKSGFEFHKTPSKLERDNILNLASKLLVATETVAQPKKGLQSRDSETSITSEEHFLPAHADPPGRKMRPKSAYSDPCIHRSSKKQVGRFTSSNAVNRKLKDRYVNTDSDSLRSSARHSEHYVQGKKPASYPSSLASQNSLLSPKFLAENNIYQVINDNQDLERLDKVDDHFFDRDLLDGNPNSYIEWFERKREKILADLLVKNSQETQAINNEAGIPNANGPFLLNISRSHPASSQAEITRQIEKAYVDGIIENTVGGAFGLRQIEDMSTQTSMMDQVMTYEVYIVTGDKLGASTKANVRINIFGEYGSSGDRQLHRSKTGKVPFHRGQVDVFDLDCKFLGKLSSIRVGHSSTAAGDSWYFEKVYVKPGQAATKAYSFICNKWLSAKQGDGQIVRDVMLSSEVLVTELPSVQRRKSARSKKQLGESSTTEVSDVLILPSSSKPPKLKRNTDKELSHLSQRPRQKKLSIDASSSIRSYKKKTMEIDTSTLSSGSSNYGSDSFNSDSESENEKMKEGKGDKHNSTGHEKPQVNDSGRISKMTQKMLDLNLSPESSTDTSIASFKESSPHRKGSHSKGEKKRIDVSIPKPKGGSLEPIKKSQTNSESSSKESSKTISHDGNVLSNDSSDSKTRREKKVSKVGISKKSSKTDMNKKEKVPKGKLPPDKRSPYKPVPPKSGKGKPPAVVEEIIVTQETPDVESEPSKRAVANKFPEKLVMAEEINPTVDSEDEKIEFSNKDTIKKYALGDDDLYMAGFRAGINALKAAEKESNNPEEKEVFNEVVKKGPTIHEACEEGDLERVKELIESVPELKNKVDERGWAPIHISTAFGHLDILKWLSISGINLSEETQTGYTAIHLAAMNGHVNCIMILAAMGCPISSRTMDQLTPLHLAAMSGHIECIKWLLSNRAKIDAKDVNGRTPLDIAEEYQHEECVELFQILKRELGRKDSIVSLLRNPNAFRKNSVDVSDDGIGKVNSNGSSDEKEWVSDAEETSEVVGRGGDERSADQRRASVQVGRRNSITRRPSVDSETEKSTGRRMSRQDERQALQLEEKKRNFEIQKKLAERKQSSFLDAIRQEIDGIEDTNF